MVSILDNLRKDIKMQKETDRQMSTLWVLVFLLPIIIGIISSIYSFVLLVDIISSIDLTSPYNISYNNFVTELETILIAVGFTYFVNVAVSLILTFLLVNRRFKHFKRQKILSEDIIEAIDSLAKTKQTEIEVNLLSLERITIESNAEKIDKNAILWAILSAFIPFIQLYVYYFLMKDYYRHEIREDNFWMDTSRELNKIGVNFSLPQRKEPIPNRSFVLYLTLTIITSGLFSVYWIYILIKDPNEHFKYHIKSENQLITALEHA